MYKKYKRRLKQIGKDVDLSVDDADEDSPFFEAENDEEIRPDSEADSRDGDSDNGDATEEKQLDGKIHNGNLTIYHRPPLSSKYAIKIMCVLIKTIFFVK